MPSNRETLLCRYHYDPLDRLVDCTPSAQASAQRFYLKDRLATEIQGAVRYSIMQHDAQLLAQQQRQTSATETRLLATDQQRSVLNALDAARPHPLAYSPYGHRRVENGLLSLLGFNGERPDPVTGWYLLGKGYRAFNPVLMRFNSPDSWSSFGEGGANAYAYCVGDPVNLVDPTGHIGNPFKGLLNLLGRTPSRARSNLTNNVAVQSHVGSSNSRVSLSSLDGPPPYSVEASATDVFGRTSRGENGVPLPTYIQSQTDLRVFPNNESNRAALSGNQSTSTPNLEAAPPYVRNVHKKNLQIDRQLKELAEHRQRIRDNTRGIQPELLGQGIRDTLKSIKDDRRRLKALKNQI
ncbi:RHS repeat-associated core domain-containing protein [Pseudomonas vancouverensis]|uniref:RHS repeat-associated core domain-containing protein n=1 Tax=Pseudomonas vancouverensis TaxID=95300 RepID=UPI00087CB381|nr:RHS repeat-associated core domain-containing protein [Pseudomonas vancouverensis]SDV16612.1 RHS repeat-associated core domain-containing protein [Pseudomonas vancouverensis]